MGREPPSRSTPRALRAVAYAEGLWRGRIWFDSWGNDLRDNDLNGVVDDRREQGLEDGSHHGQPYSANVCRVTRLPVDHCPAFLERRVSVEYKVCIDVPLESYRAAGLHVPPSTFEYRRIPNLARWFGEHPREWRTWRGRTNIPDRLLPGDFVAVIGREHQHSGIVRDEAFGLISHVLNLPGPSVMRRYLLYEPSRLNDIISVAAWVWRSFLGFDFVARPLV